MGQEITVLWFSCCSAFPLPFFFFIFCNDSSFIKSGAAVSSTLPALSLEQPSSSRGFNLQGEKNCAQSLPGLSRRAKAAPTAVSCTELSIPTGLGGISSSGSSSRDVPFSQAMPSDEDHVALPVPSSGTVRISTGTNVRMSVGTNVRMSAGTNVRMSPGTHIRV